MSEHASSPYTHSSLIGIVQFSMPLRPPLLPVVVIDTNRLLPFVRDVALGKNSAFLRFTAFRWVNVFVAPHVAAEVLEEDKLERFSTSAVSPDQLRQTFLERFAPHLHVLDAPHGNDRAGVADADDVPLAWLTELIAPDATLSRDKHLTKSGLATPNDVPELLMGLSWSSGQQSVMISLAFAGHISIELPLRAALDAGSSWWNNRTPLQRNLVFAAGTTVALGLTILIALPQGRAWLTNQIEHVRPTLDRIGNNVGEAISYFAGEYQILGENVTAAQPILDAARPRLEDPENEFDAAIRVLARALVPRSIAELRGDLMALGYGDLVGTERALAARLRSSGLVRHIDGQGWTLRTITVEAYLKRDRTA